ncbi:MAG: catalase/peroxidase HPI [Novosphingobium sp.]|nr:catalase/peroxidase HPI [Novosphingobium sp.]
MPRNTISIIALLAATMSPLAVSSPALAEEKVMSNEDWWPERLDLQPLRQHGAESNPMGDDFNYAEEFKTLDLDAVKKDVEALMTSSQDWWPADYGHYGPFFIRMAWHSAGTYRLADGRGGAAGGQQRFEPLNSWPDNVSLDKARRLLWPIKQKYGRKLSWADLMVLTGNVAMESMGFKTYGFAGGREDDWEADTVFWGPENKWLTADRFHGDGKLKGPLAATMMGLIYVNPEGPNANHDPVSAAERIRLAFGQMAMNDEETVALIAGGHTFGKAHGAHKVADCLDADPAAAGVEMQGLGWANKCGKGHSEDTITSGLEGAWTSNPIAFTHDYLTNLFAFEWKQVKSPAGAVQWIPTDESAANMVPDAHVEGKRHAPIMFTTDLALKEDPAYRKIAKRFQENPEEFSDAFSRAWFKLTHRDMGPQWRYLGSDVPEGSLVWQDPIPQLDHALVDEGDVASLKRDILGSGLTVPQLVRTAWAAAASYRDSDMRGGTDGGRIRLAPQRDWAVNNPKELATVLGKLDSVRERFNKRQRGDKRISLADMAVLGGAAAIEQAAKQAGHDVTVPFTPGRMDASQEQTDVASFEVLEPKADGFRNYYSSEAFLSPAKELVERADLLGLTVPEMTVLVGGMRALNANTGQVAHGVFTDRPGQLSNDFFVNLLDMSTKWSKSSKMDGLYEGYDRASGKLRWTATPVDLVFGSNSELRAVSEVYASDDADQKFTEDFVAAWTKVMNQGRF